MRMKVLYAALLLATLRQTADAARLDYTLELGVQHTDNVQLVRSTPVSDTLLVPRVGLTFVEEGSTVQATVSGLVEYIHYTGNTYENETRAALDANVNWVLVPERLSWTFFNSLGVEPIQLRVPTAPNNVQQVNVFATGPTLLLQHSPNTSSVFELRYLDAYAEVTDEFDSRRVVGAYRFRRKVSATGTFSLNAEAQDTRFDDNTLAIDHDSRSAYLGYSHNFNDLIVDASAGYNWLEFDNGDSTSAPLARLSLEWQANSRNRFRARLGWQYSDLVADALQGIDFQQPDVAGIEIGGRNVTPDVYEEVFASGEHIFEGDQFSVRTGVFGGTYRHRNSLASAIDRDERNGWVNASYRLRPLLTLGAQVAIGRTTYVDLNDSDRNRHFGLYLERQWARHWRWRVDAIRSGRSAPGDNETRSYDENRAIFRIIYQR